MCTKKMITFVCLLLTLALTSASYGGLVCSWEDTSGDGCVDWGSGESIADPTHVNDRAVYSFQQTVGVTDGDYSLGVTHSGWGQSLALSLNATQRADFLANDKFEIDFSIAAGTGGGWAEIYAVSINVEGYAWTDLGDKPAAHIDSWDGSPEQTLTVIWDYTGFVPVEVPGYVEFILALNSGDGVDTMYFDNAKLTPEPATIALLGLGGLALLRRRRR